MRTQPEYRQCGQDAGAFTILEILMTIGVIAVVAALSVPGLIGTREKARRVRYISDARAVALAVVSYSIDARDLPPVVFGLPPSWPEHYQDVKTSGVNLSGSWFGNTQNYYMLLDPFLPDAILK